jgi:hypothetical protein
MRFHEYRTMWSEMQGQLPRHVTEEMFYANSATSGMPAEVGRGPLVQRRTGGLQPTHRSNVTFWPSSRMASRNSTAKSVVSEMKRTEASTKPTRMPPR